MGVQQVLYQIARGYRECSLVERHENDYVGSPVNRAARIMNAAHGGQVIVSKAVHEQVANWLPQPISLRDLGVVRLRDLSRPERVFQVVHPALRQEFAALRSMEDTPNNLPQQTTSFVGRELELTELWKLLPGHSSERADSGKRSSRPRGRAERRCAPKSAGATFDQITKQRGIALRRLRPADIGRHAAHLHLLPAWWVAP
jgi:hypothetical protein